MQLPTHAAAQQPIFFVPTAQPASSRLQCQSVQCDRVPQSAPGQPAQCVQTKPAVPVNKSKQKRIRRRLSRKKEISLKLMGNNANSLFSKLEALEFVLFVEKPSAIFLQETRLGRPGRIKTPTSSKYIWYELHRTEAAEKGVKGGGIAIGVLNALEPSWISQGDDNTEALTIEIWLNSFPVRLVCGYGPQEYDSKERKDGFWEYLNEQVQKAATEGTGLIIQMDGNLWAGGSIVMGDLKVQNQNGKMFEQYLTKNPTISVGNALPLCQGKFTRVVFWKDFEGLFGRGLLLVFSDKMPDNTLDKILDKFSDKMSRQNARQNARPNASTKLWTKYLT